MAVTRSEHHKFDNRLRYLYWIIASAHVLLICGLGYLQLLYGGDYLERADDSRLVEHLLAPKRGIIKTSDGIVLAETIDSFDTRLCYYEFYSPKNEKDFPNTGSDVRPLDEDELSAIDRYVNAAESLLRADKQEVSEEIRSAFEKMHGRVQGKYEEVQELRILRELSLSGDAGARERFIATMSRVERFRSRLNYFEHSELSNTQEIAEKIFRLRELLDKEEEIMSLCASDVGMFGRQSFLFIEKKKSDFVDFVKNPFRVVQGISFDAVISIESRLDEYPAFSVESTYRRSYPSGDLAAHVIGYVDDLNVDLEDEGLSNFAAVFEERERHGFVPDEVEKALGEARLRKFIGGYVFHNELAGMTGIERYNEFTLRGNWGVKINERDVRGRVHQNYCEILPKNGDELTLSIQSEIQKAAQHAIDGRKGAIVVVDVSDGRILAIASAPTYCPQNIVEPMDDKTIGYLYQNDSLPMLNRAMKGLYPPGSIFKMVTAIAALEEGVIDSGTTIPCSGSYRLSQMDRNPARCAHIYGHGPGFERLNLEQAIETSCNVFFYDVSRRLGNEALSTWSSMFGMGARTGLESSGEYSGNNPNSNKDTWFLGDQIKFGIGQFDLLVTPVQMARMTMAVANGGNLYPLTILENEKTDSVDHYRLPISEESLNAVKRGLVDVVEGRHGTANRARLGRQYLGEWSVAGKTGTAQRGAGRMNLAWFAGYAPANDPRIAFAIVLEDTRTSGGEDAATRLCDVVVAARRALSDDGSRQQ
ncbi:MAG: penicillin-binding transpeptidase domain-containing protein [Planctomycetes bacterium]|nr:penicillin-binding transpeptidase domain-containing protein [Planctomycetota bacterium]